ncbi:MAG: hypothetical protein FGM24_03220 [Candidatus Kapabacteria bacterium]|nr:hypothetical protein [Candidatus Kapabacteria bacterium]
MIGRLSSLMVILTIAIASAGAQTAGAPPKGREYRLQALYRPGIAQNYEITEIDTVVRTHSDSSTKSYTRKVVYFATVRCTESLDGFSTLTVNLDSLQYAFASEGVELTYDSQKDVTIKQFADLTNYVGPMNRQPDIRYNAYGDVLSVKGEQLEWMRDYLKDNGDGLDSVMALIWNQSVADGNILQYSDLQKRVLPGKKVAVDSSWQHDLQLRLDGVMFAGKVRSKLAGYSGGLYSIVLRDTIQVVPDQPIHAYGVPYIASVLDGRAVVDHTIELAASGSINHVVSSAKARFRARAYNEVFTHDVTSITTWKLTGQYQW